VVLPDYATFMEQNNRVAVDENQDLNDVND